MGEGFFKELIGVYGPLALGWPVALFYVRQNAALQAQILAAFLADTEAKVELRNAVEKLTTARGG